MVASIATGRWERRKETPEQVTGMRCVRVTSSRLDGTIQFQICHKRLDWTGRVRRTKFATFFLVVIPIMLVLQCAKPVRYSISPRILKSRIWSLLARARRSVALAEFVDNMNTMVAFISRTSVQSNGCYLTHGKCLNQRELEQRSTSSEEALQTSLSSKSGYSMGCSVCVETRRTPDQN